MKVAKNFSSLRSSAVIMLICRKNFFPLFLLFFCSIARAEEINLGGIFALTGLGSTQGVDESRAAQLAVFERNKEGGVCGKKIRLYLEDVSLDRLSRAGVSVRKLISINSVLAIIGPTWDEPAEAILPIINSEKVPLIGPNQTKAVVKKGNSSFFFSTWPDSAIGVKLSMKHIKKMGVQNLGVIRPIPAGFFEYVSLAAIQEAITLGITLVEQVDLNDPDSQDFRTPILRLKQKKADTIFIPLADPNACTLLRQAATLNFKGLIVATDSAGSEDNLKLCPKLMENLIFSYPKKSKSYLDFEKRFFSYFKRYPSSPSAAPAYDATSMVLEALESTNCKGSSALANELRGIKDFRGVSLEKINFDSDGFVITSENDWDLFTVREEKFISIANTNISAPLSTR